MPPKKGNAGKRKGGVKVRTSEEEENLPPIDVQYNSDLVDGLLVELQEQMDTKCSQLQKDSEFMVSSITQAFHLELIKLPTQVKQMSLSRFQEEFGDSLAAVARGAINGGALGPPLSNRTNNIPIAKTTTNPYGTVSKSTKSTSKVFETPSSNKTNGGTQLLSTAMRQPREGEKIVSANGSPLGDFQTVVKAPKPAGAGLIIPPTPGVLVPLESGDVLDMDAIDVSLLSKDKKEDALMKMQAMMNSIQMAMSRLGGGVGGGGVK